MSDLVGVYRLVNAIPSDIIAATVYFFAGWFTYAGREFVEGCPISFNVSRCSAYGLFAFAVCIHLAAVTLQNGLKMIPVTNWLPYQIVLLLLCVSVGINMGKRAAASSDPQFFVDYINNFVAVPLQAFLFFTLILSSLVMGFYTGDWTWRQPVMLVCLLIILPYTFWLDTRKGEGRLQQRTWLNKHAGVICSWVRNP